MKLKLDLNFGCIVTLLFIGVWHSPLYAEIIPKCKNLEFSKTDSFGLVNRLTAVNILPKQTIGIAVEEKITQGRKTGRIPILFSSSDKKSLIVQIDNQTKDDEATIVRIIDPNNFSLKFKPITTDEIKYTSEFLYKGKKHLALFGWPFRILDVEQGKIVFEQKELFPDYYLEKTLLPKDEGDPVITLDAEKGIISLRDPLTLELHSTFESRQLIEAKFAKSAVVRDGQGFKNSLLILSETQVLRVNYVTKKIHKLSSQNYRTGPALLSDSDSDLLLVSSRETSSKEAEFDFSEFIVLNTRTKEEKIIKLPFGDSYSHISHLQKTIIDSVPYAFFIVIDSAANPIHVGLLNLKTFNLQLNEFRPRYLHSSYRIVSLNLNGQDRVFFFATSPGRSAPMNNLTPRIKDPIARKDTKLVQYPVTQEIRARLVRNDNSAIESPQVPYDLNNFNGFGEGVFYSIDGTEIGRVDLPEGTRSLPLFYSASSYRSMDKDTAFLTYQGSDLDTMFRMMLVLKIPSATPH